MREADTASSSRAILEEGMRMLANAGIDTARLDAEVLLADACEISRASLITGSVKVSARASQKFRAMFARRALREPLAYIIGRKEFFSLEFEVTPAVLIPRPETETLVEAALKFIELHPESRVLDIGTGSGAIAIAIAVNAPRARLVAIDISNEALEVAGRNADRLGCVDRIEFIVADLVPNESLLFDLILSNPPYVGARELDALEPEIRFHEPRVALTAGADGLALHRRIANESRSRLKADGVVMVEIGAGQRAEIEGLFRRAGFSNIDALRDLAQIERVIRARVA